MSDQRSHPLRKRKRKKKEEEESGIINPEKRVALRERRALDKTNEKERTVITLQKYKAMWSAYGELQSVSHVAKECKVPRALAAFVIEEGWPSEGMTPLAPRMAKIRRTQQDLVDYDVAKANAENAQLVRGIGIRLRTALGPRLENIGFDKEAIGNMSPGQMGVFVKGLDKLFRLESFLLNEGADRSVKEVRIVGGDGSMVDELGSGKLSSLLDSLETGLDELREKGLISEDETTVIEAEFSESPSTEKEPKSPGDV